MINLSKRFDTINPKVQIRSERSSGVRDKKKQAERACFCFWSVVQEILLPDGSSNHES